MPAKGKWDLIRRLKCSYKLSIGSMLQNISKYIYNIYGTMRQNSDKLYLHFEKNATNEHLLSLPEHKANLLMNVRFVSRFSYIHQVLLPYDYNLFLRCLEICKISADES